MTIDMGIKPQQQDFYQPIKNRSLGMPSIVGEYQKGNLTPDSYSVGSALEVFNNINNMDDKYIGSVPKIGDNAKLGLSNTTPKAKIDSDSAISAVATVGKGISDYIQAGQNIKRNEYENKIQNWLSEGKYWMDPNADLKPDIESFLAEMPSSQESLGSEPSYLLKEAGKGAATGATIGASLGGGVGAGAGVILGGIVGVVEGLFSWSEAGKEDVEYKKKALNAYKRSLKEWTFKRNKRLLESNNARKSINQSKATAVREKESATKNNLITTRRSMMMSLLSNAGSITSAQRNNRLRRWAA